MPAVDDFPVLPDLSDPELYRSTDPVPLWARLRATQPIYYTAGASRGPFWTVLSHGLVTRVLADVSTFVSERGMRLEGDPLAAQAAAGKMLIVTDPPRHGQIKRIIGSAYTPRMVARLRATMHEVVRELLDEALDRDVCEFTDVAARLPVSIICDMLGVPRRDWPAMLRLTMTAFGCDSETTDDEMTEAYAEIFLYYADLVQRRRREPGDDVVTALVQGRIDGVPLTDEEIFLNCTGLISGGNETTRHGTVGGLLALVEHPEAWQQLRADPGLVPSAVQEILRYAAPVLHVRRTAVRDTEVGGVSIHDGDRLALWLPAANRDPAAFPDPDTFDVARSPNRHVTFAHGTHYCLGGPLAVTEMEVLFEELVRRTGHPELAGAPVRLRSNLIWGFSSLPVRLVPA